jgi:predicted SAM-dependent methyltransferase
MSIRINIGCGQTPTAGWRNYDSSWSIKLAGSPRIASLLEMAGVLSSEQREFIDFAKTSDILWADATTKIPEADGCVDTLYTSHMVEHLERDRVMNFLKEARRVLRKGGIIRVAVPDIRHHIDKYLEDQDADRFIEQTHLTRTSPRTLVQMAKYFMIGDRNHQWMYDGRSLCGLLTRAGFQDAAVAPAGTTRIPDCPELDLSERVRESVFAEAVNP